MAAKAADRTEIFRSYPVPKAIATMAIPTIISQMINLIYNMADTFFIGRTGNSYMVAAASVGLTVFLMTISFANLFGIGGGSLMARLAGSGEGTQAKSVCAFSIYGAMIAALLYSLIIWAFMRPVLYFLGASENSIDYAMSYCFYVVVLGDIPVVLSMALAHLLRNAGFPRQASIGLSGGGVLNILLDPLFMFVLLPKGMEVTGAAIATLLSNVASCIYLLFAVQKASKDGMVSLRISDAKLIRKTDIRAIFRVGVPSAILTGLFDIGNMVLIKLMAVYGDISVAALGICMKIERVPNAFNLGICQGTLPLIAYNYASGNQKRMREVVRDSRVIGFAVSILSLILLRIFAVPFSNFFISTNSGSGVGAAETVAVSAIFLGIRCFASPVQFLNFSNSYAMQAVGFGGGTLLHAVVRILGVYIPLMFLLNSLFGVNGLVTAIVVGEAISGVFAHLLFRHLLKRNRFQQEK